MFKTKEIRWFFKEANKPIKMWFESLELGSPDKREDIYLSLKNDSLSVKLRGREIEVKQRIGVRSKGCLNSNAWGSFENWIKWSFEADTNDKLLSKVIQGKYERWISISKERMAVQITKSNGNTRLFSSSQIVEEGCQLEYSKLSVQGETWYTFGLEWFGATCIELNSSLISKILCDSELNLNQSMGYPAFLSEHIHLKSSLTATHLDFRADS
ncbi:hypothetical protein [Kriegella aquimaris]|uniref:Uncharacterized protein n=1 Tax=Kriegella aquimaris TaxID=192904 RepID=A0A1G9J9E7_9FLAO|nr:hypothetical protein [Kriegella aquimaris]SDL34227.1 hypothetical protein SAMN04488514_101465 [Kriegella aquimaris]